MKWTEEEIASAVSEGTLNVLSLDTSVFDGERNRFEHGLLVRLRQFRATDVRVVLAEVVRREVQAHVAKAAAEDQDKLRAALRGIGLTWQVASENRDSALKNLFGDETPLAFAERRVGQFLADSGIEVIDCAGRVRVEDLVHDYFMAKAPFGRTADKKNEFPDAIALRSLEHWAEETDRHILVVSKDNDWVAYCATSPRLVCVKDLAAAIGYFQQSSAAICLKLSEMLESGTLDVEDEVRDRLAAAVDGSDFIPDAGSEYSFDYDVVEIEVSDVQFQEQDDGNALIVVERPEEDVIVVAADVEVTYDVTTSFAFSIKDGIDKDMVPIGSTNATASVTIVARVLLTFEDVRADTPELWDVEVELPKRYHRVDYGHVSPSFERDWDDEWMEPEEADQG
ncbi:MAG: hypothetical protein EOO23_05625 [Comamonadaceae bacterium]|nr:MAG: hypothetical protein EOO23_05625 [Comamonadaceae bacterium]